MNRHLQVSGSVVNAATARVSWARAGVLTALLVALSIAIVGALLAVILNSAFAISLTSAYAATICRIKRWYLFYVELPELL